MRLLLIALGLSGLLNQAQAYPEMIRHGYINCTACHTSLVGGTMLNAYGRSLSRELISQETLWGKKSPEGDEQFAYGLIPTPEWLQVGGDLRLLQTFVENKQSSKARFLIMQVEIDLLARVKDNLDFFFAAGRLEPKTSDPTAKDFVYFPRWGFDWRLTPQDQELQSNIRVGRFIPAYGINFSEHIFVTRTYLEFGPGQERFGADWSVVNDKYSVVATAILGLAAGNQNKPEKGGILQVSRAVGERSKVGLNYYHTQREDNGLKYDRVIAGGFAYMGFSKEWFGLLEANQPRSADGKKGLVETFKLGREIHQGLQVFATHEYANLDKSRGDPKYEAYGLGTQWFPRPHWELYGAYRKERNTALSDDYQDVVWLIGHFYL